MTGQFWSTREQVEQLRPHFPKVGARPRTIGRTKGGLRSKLHAVIDAQGRPIRFLLTAG